MKIIKKNNIEFVSDNDFTKIFKYKNDIDLYFSKAYDEETQKHFLVASIPQIAELQVAQINYPFAFDVESERDAYFEEFDIETAEKFLENLIETIKQQKIEGNKKFDSKDTDDVVQEM